MCTFRVHYRVDVFHEGEKNVEYPKYRFPSLLETKSGVLLAFSGVRDKEEENGHDEPNHTEANKIVVKRSLNQGKTWGEIIYVAGPEDRANNPTVLQLTDGRILLQFVQDDSKICNNYQIWSYDDGKTWKDLTCIDKFFPNISMIHPGPGRAIQLEDSGRILFCGRDGWKNTYIYYSDDLGKTYKITKEGVHQGYSECQFAILKNSSILINARGPGKVVGIRGIGISNDNGTSFSPFQVDKEIYGSVCQASLLNHNGNIYYSAPYDSDPHKRKKMMVSKLDDSGWKPSEKYLIWEFMTGYSCLSNVGDSMGVLYENGILESYTKISFAYFTI